MITNENIVNKEKKDSSLGENSQGKEYFEYSFLKFTKLRVGGKKQSEIRKTVIQTWWLHLFTFLFAVILIISIGNNVLREIVLLLFK